jgi:5-methylcytosine-specific restriction endonuclease McrA
LPAAAAPERPAHRAVVTPLAPERYRVQFTVGEATHEKLRRVQDLLRREIPDGDPGAIFDRALTLLLEDVARKKVALTSQPRNGQAAATRSRQIPARVKRAVWLRDGGRCAFVASAGRRCNERAFLEFHHREPYAVGGEATVANISLRCRQHNAYEGERVFGTRVGGPVPAEFRAPAARSNSPRGELDTS